ncbi:hypothetical protein [Salmonirosea aquatica]|uniref:ParB/Sulfiredoxin domain-containing protein n=1 Tax=Salmonirosea aquatica TaxID=2654236 RepID=A0A7C9F9E2_9BACT|nr:hypothetical protein [Cytophagaceae bacterium SJW1-29]
MAKTSPLDKLKEKTADMKIPMFQQEIFIKSNLIVVPELRSLIPPLKVDEREQLEVNLLANGIKDPLTVWETSPVVVKGGLDSKSVSNRLLDGLTNDTKIYVLIDGHNRYDLAQKHGLDFRINIESFADMQIVRDYMINYQLGRRNLTPEQSSYLRGLRYNEMKESNKSGREVNVAEKLAEEYNVSARTIKRDSGFAKGLDELSPEFKQEVLSGKTQLPREAVKVLSKKKPAKPIESLDELNAVLEKMPKAFKSLDDLKGKPENTDQKESGKIADLIQGVVASETVAAQDRGKAKKGSDSELIKFVEEDYRAEDSQAAKLQMKLKSLLNEDLFEKDTLKLLIEKANELLNVLE